MDVLQTHPYETIFRVETELYWDGIQPWLRWSVVNIATGNIVCSEDAEWKAQITACVMWEDLYRGVA